MGKVKVFKDNYPSKGNITEAQLPLAYLHWLYKKGLKLSSDIEDITVNNLDNCAQQLRWEKPFNQSMNTIRTY